MRQLLQTTADPTLTWLRLSLGLVLLPHGAQKLLGWFGGDGLSGTVAFFEGQLGLPPFLTLFVIFIESFGALFLLLGLGGRLAASALLVNMVGAIITVNRHAGYFWTDGGWEFPLFLILVSVVIIVRGSGCWSLDRWLVLHGERAVGSRTAAAR